ncbi:MAG: CoA pyrophosphatase [Anaerolineae bacterium]|nr:CoA pyrophosphatase [Anaerolineae bacterium]
MQYFSINGRTFRDQEISSLLADYYEENNRVSENKNYKQASVLLLLVSKDDETSLLFTRRTERVLDHKGQVSFPGGARELQDGDQIETAIREANEEIGVLPQQITVLGCLPGMETISHYYISPIVGWAPWPIDLVINPIEVERVFLIPLTWLMARENSYTRRLSIRGAGYDDVLFFKPYEGEVVWGITARITCSLFQALGLR